MIKGIIFDMGGTIISTNNMNLRRASDSVHTYLVDKSITSEQFYFFTKKIVDDILKNRTNIEISFMRLIYLYKMFYGLFSINDTELELILTYSLFDYALEEKVVELLERLKDEKIKMIILSNSLFSEAALRDVLRKFDVEKYFDKVISSADSLVRKPYDLFFLYGVKEIGYELDNIVYIGNDYHYDCLGCKNIGLKVIYYNNKNKEYKPFKGMKEIKNYNELLREEKLCEIY
ncbi:MAG: HAD family hydrolase [Bacilli bacterium]